MDEGWRERRTNVKREGWREGEGGGVKMKSEGQGMKMKSERQGMKGEEWREYILQLMYS